jgi:hypothetical protein
MGRADRHDVAQSPLIQSLQQGTTLPIHRVGQDDVDDEAKGEQVLDQLEGQLRLGLEDVPWLEAGLGLVDGTGEGKVTVSSTP